MADVTSLRRKGRGRSKHKCAAVRNCGALCPFSFATDCRACWNASRIQRNCRQHAAHTDGNAHSATRGMQPRFVVDISLLSDRHAEHSRFVLAPACCTACSARTCCTTCANGWAGSDRSATPNTGTLPVMQRAYGCAALCSPCARICCCCCYCCLMLCADADGTTCAPGPAPLVCTGVARSPRIPPSVRSAIVLLQEPPVQPQQPAGARPGMDRSVPAVVKVVQGAASDAHSLLTPLSNLSPRDRRQGGNEGHPVPWHCGGGTCKQLLYLPRVGPQVCASAVAHRRPRTARLMPCRAAVWRPMPCSTRRMRS